PPAGRLEAGLAALDLIPPLGPDDSIAVALPGSLVATHLIALPFSDPRRIAQVLPAEVEAAIPFDLSEVVWDAAILGVPGGKTEVLVGMVKKTALREHLEALEAAGLDPRVVTLGPLALAALGERGMLVPRGGPPPTAVLLDAGPDRADVALLDAGRPVLARALTSSHAAVSICARANLPSPRTCRRCAAGCSGSALRPPSCWRSGWSSASPGCPRSTVRRPNTTTRFVPRPGTSSAPA